MTCWHLGRKKKDSMLRWRLGIMSNYAQHDWAPPSQNVIVRLFVVAQVDPNDIRSIGCGSICGLANAAHVDLWSVLTCLLAELLIHMLGSMMNGVFESLFISDCLSPPHSLTLLINDDHILRQAQRSGMCAVHNTWCSPRLIRSYKILVGTLSVNLHWNIQIAQSFVGTWFRWRAVPPKRSERVPGFTVKLANHIALSIKFTFADWTSRLAWQHGVPDIIIIVDWWLYSNIRDYRRQWRILWNLLPHAIVWTANNPSNRSLSMPPSSRIRRNLCVHYKWPLR